VLIGQDPQRGRICGSCAGQTNDYTCRVCGQGDEVPWHGGLCARCALRQRVDELLGTDPTGQLRPLAQVLTGATSPVYLLRWLSDRPAGQLLQRLAADGRPISHRLLDDLPPRAEVHYLRHILVHAGVLPERVEYLDRIGPWLAQRLAQCPPSHAQLVRPFARWFLLHRARRTAQARGYTPQASYKLRSHLLAVLEFLAWLDSQGLDLRTASQADIDAWLTTGPPSRRYRVRGFLRWARQRGTAGELSIPGRPAQYQPLRPLPDDEVWAQLRRCLHDTNIPLGVRVAGALILLFGTSVTRLVRLSVDAVIVGDGQVHLRLGRAPLLLPPPVDELVTGLAQAPVEHSTFAASFHPSRLLFPGRAPGHPIRPALRARLVRRGIAPRPGRHAAILAMTADLPTPAVADLLGVSYKTAIRWAGHAGGDWSAYVAARDEPTH
jgi:hypothetical protein